jgi:hypothetical protein
MSISFCLVFVGLLTAEEAILKRVFVCSIDESVKTYQIQQQM